MRISREERFWEKVDKTETCWVWTAGVDASGYGSFQWGNRERRISHRVSYEWAKGAIPAGLQIDHLCRNRRCVNPAHLEAVTQAENQRRAVPFRRIRPECPYGHKMTVENTRQYLNGSGGLSRSCRTCERDRARERYRAKVGVTVDRQRGPYNSRYQSKVTTIVPIANEAA